MTIELPTFKERLPLLVALTEGKTIQHRYIGWGVDQWTNTELHNLLTFGDGWQFRIKPEPKEIWVPKLFLDNLCKESQWLHTPGHPSEYVHFKEVQ